ncbi:MarR family transcriptional regulator [Rhizobium ruizarguesonis]|uniref:MarR family transcriptional regulator n=1 Tax=Rhizobium ruizarguesonis TaxID=2081791 RepID=UPI001030F3CE|nr:MarR family transcriptional regulator [Rhizobium ruizarguesonis]TAY91878.1 MarR family transcriptional regulator [Rhizobium ruizarguesonis]
MSNEIEQVVTAIKKAGGTVRPSDLAKAMSGQDKRTMQRAVQSALDRGYIEVDSQMRLTLGARVRQAA